MHIGLLALGGLSLGALSFISASGQPDNCSYAKENFERYLALCQTADGCSNRANMERIVASECGNSPQPANSQPETPANGSIRSSAADEPPSRSDPPPLPEESEVDGRECSFFTRPARETKGISTTLNYYAEGAFVCYEGTMFKCQGGRFKRQRNCASFNEWERFRYEKLEGVED